MNDLAAVIINALAIFKEPILVCVSCGRAVSLLKLHVQDQNVLFLFS